MSTHHTFSPARLAFGLSGVSVVCAAFALFGWTAHGILPYILFLILPSIGYGYTIYWSQMFGDWSVAQRMMIGVLFGFILGVGFLFAAICLRFTFYAA